uniref:Uncharacterized protein n=1 Tax=Oryza sativa subsp. japonica TaxID=39947 RepID=Q8H5L5_ORYSJ|nr:hypothetical protein [Oryza sativa Japonica Group]
MRLFPHLVSGLSVLGGARRRGSRHTHTPHRDSGIRRIAGGLAHLRDPDSLGAAYALPWPTQKRERA